MRNKSTYLLQLTLLLFSRKVDLREYLRAIFVQPVAVAGRGGIAHVVDQRR